MAKLNTRGLMIGRFQPFHKGHLELAKQILQNCEELIIAIGSAQFNYSYSDPFTAGERATMAHAALVESKLDMSRCYIIPIINDENNAQWFAHLKSMVPSFEIIYSGNDFVGILLKGQAEVLQPKFSKKKLYNGTYIRKLMINSNRWKEYVPNSVVEVIEKIDGVNRVIFLYKEKLFEEKKIKLVK
jgi:nicotinamide-nucleotide adenylyltransferase